jgi:hypothetical protein
MGEDSSLPKESNSQVLFGAEPYVDTTLESPLWAPKVHGNLFPYLSGKRTEQITNFTIEIITRTYFRYISI